MSGERLTSPLPGGGRSGAGRPTRGSCLVVAILLVAVVPPLRAQTSSEATEPRTAITPAEITVGEIFHAAIRVTAPIGARLLFPDSLDVPPDVEAAGRRTVRADTVDGGLQYTAVYPLTAWRPDTIALGSAPVRVLADGGEQSLTARFVPFTIRSVLPADTAGIEPQPPKDVFGANRLLWPFLIGLALILAALALLYLWRRRRRPRVAAPEPMPAIAPRDRALAALDEVRHAGLVEAGAFKEFYSRVSDALRQYLCDLEPRWGADLTTTELAGRMRGGGGLDPNVAALFAVLGEADLVKFARSRPVAMEALTSWGTARGFVERFHTPVADDAQTDAEAA